jgi:hypothetical protein
VASTGTATVTGKTGAGLTMTAQVFAGITSFRFNIPNAMLQLVNSSGVITDVSIAAATTVTVVLSAASGNYTITVS